MSARYLLDTDTVSDLVRNPQGKVARRLTAVGEGAVATSVIVAAELRFGAARSPSRRLRAQLDTILDAIAVLPFEPPADALYGEVRAALETAGTPIGANDLLIGAHALALKRVLVTGNEREFRRIAGLRVENWLA